MQKKVVSIILVIVLMVSLVYNLVPKTTNAATDIATNATNAANHLYQLGLFNGTGKDNQGNPIFDLDRTPTRNEAITMLIRLLGKESEAKSQNWNIPFVDVVEWAKPYIGYAYANGLTSGTSSTTYGGSESITATQYLTFILRALGYETGVDFDWKKAWELSDVIELTHREYNENTTTFTRGDLAIISWNALSCKIINKNVILINELMENGIAIHSHSYKTYENSENGYYKKVQVGTKVVDDYEVREVTTWGCCRCGFTCTSYAELEEHQAYPSDCFGMSCWFQTTKQKVKVGSHEETIYENKWITETQTICEFCGIQK